jgi:transcriptional regulator with XRE-family HTH domain
MREPTVEPNGKRIGELRLAKDWNQDVLAEKARCGFRTVQKAEAGEPIYVSILKRIAAALGANDAELFIAGSESTEQSDSGSARGLAPPMPSLVVGRDEALNELKSRLGQRLGPHSSPYRNAGPARCWQNDDGSRPCP